jgi:hypothetical protein
LATTLSVLSAALAKAKASSSLDDEVNVSRAYMAILVGLSLGTARSMAWITLNEETSIPDENEMIWWSWDGKLGGFSGW